MTHINQAKGFQWNVWVVLIGTVTWQSPEVESSDIHDGSENSWGLFQRKLLNDVNTFDNVTTGTDTGKYSGTWAYLLGALITMLVVSLLIVVMVKCQFQRYLISYRHRLLPEGDTISQYDPQCLEVGHAPQSVAERVMPRRVNMDDDDDGFIEDNYIQADERERVERERQQRHDGDESDDDELDLDQFTIG